MSQNSQDQNIDEDFVNSSQAQLPNGITTKEKKKKIKKDALKCYQYYDILNGQNKQTISREEKKLQDYVKLIEKLGQNKSSNSVKNESQLQKKIKCSPGINNISDDQSLSSNNHINCTSVTILNDQEDANLEQQKKLEDKNLNLDSSTLQVQNAKKIEKDPKNPNFKFGDSGAFFFYLFEYEEQEKQKIKDLQSQFKGNYYSQNRVNQGQQKTNIIKMPNEMFDETLLIQEKIQKKFMEQRNKLITPFTIYHKQFSQEFINQQYFEQILRPYKLQQQFHEEGNTYDY